MSEPTEFDKELSNIINHAIVTEYESDDPLEVERVAMEAIKQAVDKYVIREDQTTKKLSTIVMKPNGVNTDIYRYGTYEDQVSNKLRLKQREALWGKK